MQRLRKLLSLDQRDRYLLISAVFLLGAVRIGLWIMPLPTLRRLLCRRRQGTEALGTPNTLDRIPWAVASASRYIPGVKCLDQALATQVLLRWYGCLSNLRIGVTRSKGGQLLAHAWVERQGKIVIGDLGKNSVYTPLPIEQEDQRDRWYLFS